MTEPTTNTYKFPFALLKLPDGSEIRIDEITFEWQTRECFVDGWAIPKRDLSKPVIITVKAPR